MISGDFAFNVVLSPMDQPPEIFGVINNCDREPVRARWNLRRRGSFLWERRKSASREGQKQAQRDEPVPPPNLILLVKSHKKKSASIIADYFLFRLFFPGLFGYRFRRFIAGRFRRAFLRLTDLNRWGRFIHFLQH